jgi:DNA-binding NtrC family response regulator
MAQQTEPTVFVVDDESVIAVTLATILKQSGFRARAFTNPVEALKSAGSEVPNLLISDVLMPEMSGVDLAIQLKAIHPDCKVLLFSGQSATADFLETARAEGHDFTLLSKPVHPKDLLHALRAL